MYTTEYTRRTGGADWIPYWAAARQRELRFQRCVDCRRWRHPPGPVCPACGSARSAWERARGRSRVISVVIAHQLALRVCKDSEQYPNGLVEWTEGVRTAGAPVHAQ